MLLLLAVGSACAQAAPPAKAPRADPLEASAPVPPALHRSVLGDHRAYRPAEVGSWSEANETVNRIGGWRTYAREADAGGAAAPSAPAAVSAPVTATPPAAPAPVHRHR